MARGEQMRVLLAQEAARIMAEEGVKDFRIAKSKAAERMGCAETRHMPKNAEIEEALLAYQRLFGGDAHQQQLQELRQTALQAMVFLKDFQPRLVGPVLNGSADEDSPVNLHLFADPAEEVLMFLMNANIPFEEGERSYPPRQKGGRSELYPMYRFIADGVAVELTVFSQDEMRRAPLSPVDYKPMKRADREQLEALLNEGDQSLAFG